MKTLGLVGRAGSGKDTVADILVRDHGWVKIALADPMKRFLRDVLAFSDDQLWGPSSSRNAPDKRYIRSRPAQGWLDDQRPLYLTPRHALQQLGTEWGRACYENVWIDCALRDAARVLDPNLSVTSVNYYSAKAGPIFVGGFPQPKGVVISDCRFPNEVKAIHAAGGVVWKTTHGSGLAGAAGQHESERHIDSLEVDAVVPDGALEALPMIVTTMLKETMR